MNTLSRAKCPRCGFVVVAASPAMKDELCRAHDREVHQLPSAAELIAAFESCRGTDTPREENKPAIAATVQPD
jgi:uncharacterized OB-fold protein